MELTVAPSVEATGISLPAIEAGWAREARADPHLLTELSEGVQGPFHVLNPDTFRENVRHFQDVLRAAGVEGQVYYGKKANKSGCWLDICAEVGAGVDVASAPELVHSLAAGVRGEELVVTGAAKSDELLWLAARHRCLVAVDGVDELERVVALARRGLTPQILLRVLPEVNPSSRFGLEPAELERALEECIRERSLLDMRGFSFHLNGYEVAPRARLAGELVGRCVDARARGLVADCISIGGGFAVEYLDAEDWARFTEGYRDSWFHADRKFNHFYPYHQAPTGARMLRAILAAPAAGSDLAGELARTGTRLFLEPGRALLDRAGFTVFPVQGYKQRGDHGIVTVDGLSASISEQWKGSEYLPDPILWSPPDDSRRGATASLREPAVWACVGGASCMEYDMLTWRKAPFDRMPAYGDLLIYPNTAGYQMDKNETEFHQLSLPERIVLIRDGERFRWRLDRQGWIHRGPIRGSQL